jgi:hypothetical protein
MRALGCWAVMGLLVACNAGDSGTDQRARRTDATTGDTAAPCATGESLFATFLGTCDEVFLGEMYIELALDAEACSASGFIGVTTRDGALTLSDGFGLGVPFGPLPLTLAHEPKSVAVGVPAEALTEDVVTFAVQYDNNENDTWYLTHGVGDSPTSAGGFMCSLPRE